MPAHYPLILLSTVEILLGLAVLGMLIRTKEVRTYWPMLALSLWQIIPFFTLLYLQHLGRARIAPQHAYPIYYITYWTCYAIEAVCGITLTFTVLRGAMAPLKGLQRLGNIVYFWVAAISIFISLSAIIVPSANAFALLRIVTMQFQRVTSIITVSLIIFVCTAMRPLGLSLRSRFFGVGFGLTVLSIANALQANYLMQPRTLYSAYAYVQVAVSVITQIIWIGYFVFPEPERKFVLLSTTSPFHQWNQIAEQFGQSPGMVAIGGIPPDAFAAAEIEIFHRASAKMAALPETAETPDLPE